MQKPKLVNQILTDVSNPTNQIQTIDYFLNKLKSFLLEIFRSNIFNENTRSQSLLIDNAFSHAFVNASGNEPDSNNGNGQQNENYRNKRGRDQENIGEVSKRAKEQNNIFSSDRYLEKWSCYSDIETRER